MASAPPFNSPREPAGPPPDLAFSPQVLASSSSCSTPMEDVEHHQADESLEDEEPTGFVYQPPTFVPTVETDPHKLAQRQKQIDFGKNTVGYANYVAAVPRRRRVPGEKTHPNTPKVTKVMSKRCFDGQVKAWRRALHTWDVLPGDEHKVEVTPRPAGAKRAKERASVSPIALALDAPATPPPHAKEEKTIFDACDDDEL